MFGLPDSALTQIFEVLKKFPDIEKAVMFGSRAMGNFKPGSDVDVALFGQRLTSEKIHEVFVELEERLALPYRFDVVGYDHIDEQAFRDHIDQHGVEFFPEFPLNESK